MIDIRFSDAFNPANAAKAAQFLRGERLFIPTASDYGQRRHDSWVQQTEADLTEGKKFGVAAYEGSRVAGIVVAKCEAPTVVDIRNISISPDHRKRLFGAFALEQLVYEVMSSMPEATELQVDTKAS